MTPGPDDVTQPPMPGYVMADFDDAISRSSADGRWLRRLRDQFYDGEMEEITDGLKVSVIGGGGDPTTAAAQKLTRTWRK